MGVSAVASVIGEGIAADVVGSALTGAVVSGVVGGDVGVGALTGGIGGGIMGGLGMGGGILDYGTKGVGDVFGSAFGTSSIPGGFVGSTGEMGSGLLTTAGGLGASTAGAGAASGLGALSSGGAMGSLKSIANLAQVGAGVYNLMNPPQSPGAATQAADPWSKYRTQSAQTLNQLMQNPNMVYGMPGYQFAQQQGAKNIQRQAAATGQAISGGTLASLQEQGANTAQNWFNQYVSTLGQQAGVTNANLGVQAGQFQQNQQNAQQTAALQNIMAGAAGLSAGFFG
jgi:hypothetical protein